MAYFSRGKNKEKNVLGNTGIYSQYKKTIEKDSVYDVTGAVFGAVLREYYKAVADSLLDGSTVKLPVGAGPLRICKVKKKTKVLPIDWANTVLHSKLCFNFNEHSNGYKYMFVWGLNKTNVTYLTYYRFKPCRALARALAYKINVERHDFFEK